MPITSASSPSARRQRARADVASLRTWPPRRWLLCLAISILAAVVMGLPTGIVHSSLFTRMTAVTWWDYPVWAISALLIGMTAATYLKVGDANVTAADHRQRTIGATLLSTFAIGCPICNKLVVAVIGVSGALSYWAPLQPVLGILSIALLSTGLAVRLRGMVACPSPTR